MNRRASLKAIVAASGSLVALPSWARQWDAAHLKHHSSFLPAAQETLAAVADTIIPAGNSIGALTVGVDKYLQKLIDNCYEKEVQDNVKKQLEHLEQTSQTQFAKSFKDCDQMQREQLLLSMSTSGDTQQAEFFKLIKSETIRGFNTSREVMVNFLHYKQVPGHYHGCVDVKA